MSHFSNIYGIKKAEWDYMVSYAIDELEDVRHTALAIYPCGPCLFNLSTAKPELICIYAEETRNLLNPAYIDPCHSKIVLSNGTVHFVSLYELGKRMANFKHPFNNAILASTSLYIAEPFLEEELFLDFKYRYVDIIKKHFIEMSGIQAKVNFYDVAMFLMMRTCLIYAHTGKFVVDHRNYDISDLIDNSIAPADIKTVMGVYDSLYDYKAMNVLTKLFQQKITEKTQTNLLRYSIDVEELGNTIKELYLLEL